MIKCTKCGESYAEKDVFDMFHPLCRECAVEESHDCKGERCEVCAFVNDESDEEQGNNWGKEDEAVDLNPETHGTQTNN